jgi:hypothetical protein
MIRQCWRLSMPWISHGVDEAQGFACNDLDYEAGKSGK